MCSPIAGIQKRRRQGRGLPFFTAFPWSRAPLSWRRSVLPFSPNGSLRKRPSISSTAFRGPLSGHLPGRRPLPPGVAHSKKKDGFPDQKGNLWGESPPSHPSLPEKRVFQSPGFGRLLPTPNGERKRLSATMAFRAKRST